MDKLFAVVLVIVGIAGLIFIGDAMGYSITRDDDDDPPTTNQPAQQPQTSSNQPSSSNQPAVSSQPTPTAVPQQSAPTSAPQQAAYSQSFTVPAGDVNGVVVDLPSAGTYSFSVTGSYSTGDRNRSVVFILDGAGPAQDCGAAVFHEPCHDPDKALGDWNAPTPATKSITLANSSIRIITVDDMGSYAGDTGSVTVTITGGS